MLEIIFYNWKNISKITLITIIAICIHIYIGFSYFKQHVLDNWNYYRTKPYIIPFVGFIKRKPGESIFQSTFNNIINLCWIVVNKFLSILMMPLYPIFNIFTKLIKTYKDILDNFRKQFKVMRNFLFAIIKKIYDRLNNSVATITLFFLKLREGLKKQLGLYKMMSWTIAHSYYFIQSLLGGPVGNVGRFAETFGLGLSGFTLGAPGVFLWLGTVCFDPNTKITLKDKTIKNIKDIRLGDYLSNGQKVLATLEFDISNSQINMYEYNGIIVSSDHMVWENNRKIRISESNLSKPIIYHKKKLVCLITQNGIIPINGINFCDFLDSHDVDINHDIHRTIEGHLNKDKINKLSYSNERNKDLVWGFGNKNKIGNKELGHIKLGDTINDQKIRAVIKIDKTFLTEYKIKDSNNNEIIVSGNLLFSENNLWKRIYQSENTELINKSDQEYYINFCTDNNLLDINGILFRDFMEVNDILVNDIIDNNITL